MRCKWNIDGRCTYFFKSSTDLCKYYDKSELCWIVKEEKERMNIMENKTLEKTLDVAGSVAKIAANLSDTKKEPRPQQPFSQTDDNSNKASTGSQTVVVSMDGKKKDQKPVEKHIHEFPENRPLTEKECELSMEKAKMEYQLKSDQQAFSQMAENRKWDYMREQDKKLEKRQKIRTFILGLFGVATAGYVGYCIYDDYRSHKNPAVPKALPSTEPVQAAGKVE